MDINQLKIFRGNDIEINSNIKIHIPTLDEICNYGEREYYQMVYMLTSVGADLKWQLDDMGVDYTKVNDFELFNSLLIKNYTQIQTSIIFGDLDFNKFQLYKNNQNDEICLVQQVIIIDNKFAKYIKRKLPKVIDYIMYKYPKIIKHHIEDIIIDEYTYILITDYLRKIHGLKKNEQVPANESTRQILIDDARDEYLLNKDKEYSSHLLNLISSMVNREGFKYNYDDVWDLKINAFMDSVKRISKILNADLLLQSGYSGYGISFKDIDKKQLDWLGELD